MRTRRIITLLTVALLGFGSFAWVTYELWQDSRIEPETTFIDTSTGSYESVEELATLGPDQDLKDPILGYSMPWFECSVLQIDPEERADQTIPIDLVSPDIETPYAEVKGAIGRKIIFVLSYGENLGGALLVRSDPPFQLGQKASWGDGHGNGRMSFELQRPVYRFKLDLDDVQKCEPNLEIIPSQQNQTFWFSTLRTLDR